MCLTNLQTSMPHLPPDRSASPAPGGPATVPGQERAGKAEEAGEARAGPWTETRERSLRARALRPGPHAPQLHAPLAGEGPWAWTREARGGPAERGRWHPGVGVTERKPALSAWLESGEGGC